jgi:polynucleotide 5'-hydroxyl-kinase GRC3/NOL9
MANIQILPGWKDLADSIDKLKGVAVILGAPDTGKTKLAFYLCEELRSKGSKIAMIYADMGQCAFGLPATLGMMLFDSLAANDLQNRKLTTLDGIKIHAMYFIGSTSPLGHLIQTTVGLKKLVDKALTEGAEVVLIDTSGFVQGAAAWELKFHKIELSDARHLVALQKGQELEYILLPHEHRACRLIHRLKVYKEIEPKSYEKRRSYRRQKFLEYFQNATIRSFSLKEVKVANPHHFFQERDYRDLYKRLLVGLNDDENFSLGLGIIEDMGHSEWQILTPVRKLNKVKIIRLGSVRLDENCYGSKLDWTSFKI